MIDNSILHRIAQSANLEISEEISFPAKAARFSAIPAGLHSDVKTQIKKLYPQGLYVHQAQAIELGLAGRNVCIATSTASGKTLAFTSIAVSHLLESKGRTILVLYPAKALLHDQERKWREAI